MTPRLIIATLLVFAGRFDWIYIPLNTRRWKYCLLPTPSNRLPLLKSWEDDFFVLSVIEKEFESVNLIVSSEIPKDVLLQIDPCLPTFFLNPKSDILFDKFQSCFLISSDVASILTASGLNVPVHFPTVRFSGQKILILGREIFSQNINSDPKKNRYSPDELEALGIEYIRSCAEIHVNESVLREILRPVIIYSGGAPCALSSVVFTIRYLVERAGVLNIYGWNQYSSVHLQDKNLHLLRALWSSPGVYPEYYMSSNLLSLIYLRRMKFESAQYIRVLGNITQLVNNTLLSRWGSRVLYRFR